jgi:hypothetical protein
MSSFIDTNIIVRHLTGDSDDGWAGDGLSRRCRRAIASRSIAAETIYVLESFYELPREQVAESMRAVFACPQSR